MKKIFLIALMLVSVFFLVSATVPPESVVPAIAITVVTTVLLPFVVEGLKIVVAKTGKQWLIGKTAASIYSWVIALGLVILYYDWKALPALPPDRNEAARQILFYGAFIAQAAQFVYNAIYSKFLDKAAQAGNALLAYKLK